MFRAIVKFVVGVFGIGAGMFVALASSGMAGEGLGEVLSGGARSAEEKEAGFRKAGS